MDTIVEISNAGMITDRHGGLSSENVGPPTPQRIQALADGTQSLALLQDDVLEWTDRIRFGEPGTGRSLR
jgi:hypothetical protein